MKPKIYIAGKIAKNDFRHKLVPQLRDMDWPGEPVRCDSFIYCGPFFAGCDHGCSHGPTRHGVVSDSPCQDAQQHMTDDEIRDLVILTNNDALASADYVFAYIDCLTAYGTLVELGAAYAMGKQVLLFLGTNIFETEDHHLWYAAQQADVLYRNVSEQEFCDAVRKFSARACDLQQARKKRAPMNRSDGDDALFDHDSARMGKQPLH